MCEYAAVHYTPVNRRSVFLSPRRLPCHIRLLSSFLPSLQVGQRQWDRVLEMVRRIRGLGMEVGGGGVGAGRGGGLGGVGARPLRVAWAGEGRAQGPGWVWPGGMVVEESWEVHRRGRGRSRLGIRDGLGEMRWVGQAGLKRSHGNGQRCTRAEGVLRRLEQRLEGDDEDWMGMRGVDSVSWVNQGCVHTGSRGADIAATALLPLTDEQAFYPPIHANTHADAPPLSAGVHHAGHADPRAGGAAAAGGPDRLQPQPGHLARVLREDHHNAQIRGNQLLEFCVGFVLLQGVLLPPSRVHLRTGWLYSRYTSTRPHAHRTTPRRVTHLTPLVPPSLVLLPPAGPPGYAGGGARGGHQRVRRGHHRAGGGAAGAGHVGREGRGGGRCCAGAAGARLGFSDSGAVKQGEGRRQGLAARGKGWCINRLVRGGGAAGAPRKVHGWEGTSDPS